MAFQPINFATIPTQQQPNLIDALVSGIKGGMDLSKERTQQDLLRAQIQEAQQKVSQQRLLQNIVFGNGQGATPQSPQGQPVQSSPPQNSQLQNSQLQNLLSNGFKGNNGATSPYPGGTPYPSAPSPDNSPDNVNNQSNPMQSNQQGTGWNPSVTPELKQRLFEHMLGLRPSNEIAPGNVGQAVWLNKVKQEYGPDSEVYKNAQKYVDADLKIKQSIMDWRNEMTNTVDKRFSSPTGKLFLEKSDVDSGFMPGTNRTVQLTPEQQKDMSGQYDNRILKDVTDRITRERVLNAQNAETSLKSINIPSLTQYGGAKGQLQFKIDQGLAASGNPPANYRNYQQQATQAVIAAKQMRASLKDSISPSALEVYDDLTNPATWTIDPQTAADKFNTLKKLYNKEMSTFRGALKSPKAYGLDENTSGNNKDNDPLGIR